MLRANVPQAKHSVHSGPKYTSGKLSMKRLQGRVGAPSTKYDDMGRNAAMTQVDGFAANRLIGEDAGGGWGAQKLSRHTFTLANYQSNALPPQRHASPVPTGPRGAKPAPDWDRVHQKEAERMDRKNE